MVTGVRFCLSYELLNAILLPSKFVYFHFHCCNGRHHDVTCSSGKGYIKRGYNIQSFFHACL